MDYITGAIIFKEMRDATLNEIHIAHLSELFSSYRLFLKIFDYLSPKNSYFFTLAAKISYIK